MGPDRAAAEWVLRLGGSVKFGSFESWTTDYNRMPAEPRERTRLEAINASGISITNNGLEHLGEALSPPFKGGMNDLRIQWNSSISDP